MSSFEVRSMEMLFEKDDVCERMLFMERGECRYSTGEAGCVVSNVVRKPAKNLDPALCEILHKYQVARAGASKILALAASAKSRSFAAMIQSNTASTP
eukprot:6369054-Amphidinium_carterae.1